MFVATASAQTFDIQTFANEIAPPPKIEAPRPIKRTVEERHQVQVSSKVDKSDPVVTEELDRANKENPEKTKQAILEVLKEEKPQGAITPFANQFLAGKLENPQLLLSLMSAPLKRQALARIPGHRTYDIKHSFEVITTKREIVELPKTTLTASLPSSFSIDSNVFTRHTNVVSDVYYTSGPSVLLKVPTSKYDKFTLSLVSSSARFNEQTVLNSDVVAETAAYASVISTSTPDSKSKTSRTEQVKLQLGNQNVYGPGFSGSGTHIYSPRVGWSLIGLALDPALCGKAKALVNCYVASISVEGGRTWIGNSGAAKNTSAKVEADFDWQIRGSELVWRFAASATDRYYDDAVGGDRNDVLYILSSNITWTPSDYVTLSASAEYDNRQSTRESFEYGKSLIVPMLTANIKLW